MEKKVFFIILLCLASLFCNAQKQYYLVTFEVVPAKQFIQGNMNTLIFTIPVDPDYYHCVIESQLVTNYFPCRDIKILGLLGVDWKLVIRNKQIKNE